ncbi:hypothetical protein ACFQH2_01345 [Natronoarchaeum sp. GCM10025703]|uniref:hypothetical protein n=1 Tax=unclassified Natronoarchaeum TaxID=2620183 RepID=UPI00361F6472
MRRTVAALVALAVVVSMVAAAPMAVAGQAFAQDDENDDDENGVEPGEQFAGVVAVHESEFEGEMSERTFGVKMAQSANASAQGEIVGEQVKDVEQRLDDLDERVAELEEQRAKGEITEGRYQAEMAVVASERQTAANLATQSEASAQGLDAEILTANGINVTAIMTLQERANELGGPAVAEAAQTIAGGNGPADAGPRVEIGAGADGKVGVDIPGLNNESDDDENRSEASADAGADAGTDDTQVDAEMNTDVDTTDDGKTTVDGETETEAGADH